MADDGPHRSNTGTYTVNEETQMPTLSQIITDHPDQFADMPEVAKTLESITGKLAGLGFTPILAGNAKDKPDFVPYARVEELSGQKSTQAAQIAELTKRIEAMKPLAAGNETLTKQIEAMQTQLTEGESKRKALMVDSAIKLAAITAKAKDAGDVSKFIDASKVVVNDDGSVTGIDEQIKALQESKAYLFGDATPVPGGGGNLNGGNPPAGLDAQIAEAEKAGNVMLAIQLKSQRFKLGQ
jgi:hypothetical protein